MNYRPGRSTGNPDISADDQALNNVYDAPDERDVVPRPLRDPVHHHCSLQQRPNPKKVPPARTQAGGSTQVGSQYLHLDRLAMVVWTQGERRGALKVFH